MWRWIVYGLIGLALGAGSALAISRGALGDDSLNNEGWTTNLTIGADAANPWVRARIAVVGLLALNKSETLYFGRNLDSAGKSLQEACTYRLTGSPISARWWSVTLYGADNMLPRNEDNHPSLDLTALGPGEWTAVVSPQKPADQTIPWISSKGAGDFDLTLRLYNPESIDPSALEAMKLPNIETLTCGAASTEGRP